MDCIPIQIQNCYIFLMDRFLYHYEKSLFLPWCLLYWYLLCMLYMLFFLVKICLIYIFNPLTINLCPFIKDVCLVSSIWLSFVFGDFTILCLGVFFIVLILLGNLDSIVIIIIIIIIKHFLNFKLKYKIHREFVQHVNFYKLNNTFVYASSSPIKKIP